MHCNNVNFFDILDIFIIKTKYRYKRACLKMFKTLKNLKIEF